jgi:hypothetical protein
VSEGHLVLAMEFKSQAGKSIGNNVNNRSEEAVGSAKDVWIAYREGRFGKASAPFLGYLFLLEDRNNVKTPSEQEAVFQGRPGLSRRSEEGWHERRKIFGRLVQQTVRITLPAARA